MLFQSLTVKDNNSYSAIFHMDLIGHCIFDQRSYPKFLHMAYTHLNIYMWWLVLLMLHKHIHTQQIGLEVHVEEQEFKKHVEYNWMNELIKYDHIFCPHDVI